MNALLWTGAGALGLWLGMPNPLVQLPMLALLYPAALFALGREATSVRRALRAGWLCGFVGASACMYWVAIPVHEFGGLPWPLAAPCALFMGLYIGLYGGLFAVLAHKLTSKEDSLSPWQIALGLGLGWYLLEWFRGWFLSGFPWLSLASAFAPWPLLVQGVSVVGTYGLSGVLVGLVCLLFPPLKSKPFWRTLPVWGGVLCFALLLVFGWWRVELVYPLDAPTTTTVPVAPGVPVALVQGNLDQNVKWEPSMQRLTVQRYLTLSTEALAFPAPGVGRPSLLLWPETAMPFDYQRNKAFPSQIRAYASEHNVALLFGSPGFRRVAPPATDKTDTFNRAYLVTAGEDSGWYEKEHLVPFGEYMPPFLDIPFLRPLLQGVGNFTSGEKIVPLTVVLPSAVPDTAPADTVAPRNPPDKPLVLGVLICYETVFPELARQRVADGAEVFVNISNDAWFGRSAAPEQHLQLTLLRAVEQGRWLMRATNTGLSAFIDPAGRVRARSALFTAQTLSARVVPLRNRTVFFHVEPWLPALALLVFLGLCRGCFFGHSKPYNP